ncbi:MAG: phytanoyl-CoA dioxygenase family protein [Alphaproteobacteria bacterium]|nr:phytanoyl-CoA dioxygenase family protein [Alphaproteobacteria bacterium]
MRPSAPERRLKALTPEAAASYRRDGVLFPIRVVSEAQALELRRHLESHEARTGGPIAGSMRHKSHLLFTWLWDLVHAPTLLDAVEDVLGPNLLCWSTNFFIKEAGDGKFVSWHQDSTYWGLSEPDVVTAWVALSPATVENGAMRMIPGSHGEQVKHRDTYSKDNLLTRGQEIEVDVDESRAVSVVLRPGEMSLHHVRIVHGSEPNRSDDRRIGLAIRYVPTYVRQLVARETATLVRGVDEYRNFDPETGPEFDLSPQALAQHKAITERQAQILYAGTKTKSFDKVVPG